MHELLYYVILAFAVSFISNVTPFFGAAYTVYASLILLDLKPTIPLVALFIVVTALGAAVSKNIMYLIGVALRRPMSRGRNMVLLRGLLKLGYMWLIVVILATIPGLPLDDYVYVGTGAAGASLTRLNAYVLLGKLIKSAIEIPIELTMLRAAYEATSMLGLTRLDLQIAFAVAFTVAGIMLYRLDWLSIYNWLRGRISLLPEVPETED
ncbi:MAG: hypothetical protein RXQ00_08000 [Caldivirga sp.]